jgi:hypothetical protein
MFLRQIVVQKRRKVFFLMSRRSRWVRLMSLLFIPILLLSSLLPLSLRPVAAVQAASPSPDFAPEGQTA